MEIKELTKELLEYNCSEHAEKKNGLTYLSWAWACTIALKHDPEFSYEVQMFEGKPYIFEPNLGYMVFTTVTLGGAQKSMQLPVMDNRNNAMTDEDYTYETSRGPVTVEAATMFDINTAIMRCLAKNLALFGLGMYIYAGEDLPEALKESTELTEEEKAARKAAQEESFKKQAVVNNLRR